MLSNDMINTRFMTVKGKRSWQSRQGTSKILLMFYYLTWEASMLLLFSKYHIYVLYTLGVYFPSKEICRKQCV